MPTVTVTKKITGGSVSLYSNTTVTDDAKIEQVITLPAAKAGAISATGIDGLPTGHGIGQGALVDVHWTAAGVQKCRYGITVDTTATNAITFDDSPAAAGDTLPAEDTAVLVAVQVVVEIDFDAAACSLFALNATQNAHVNVLNNDPASMLALTLAANGLWMWADGENIANPLTGTNDDVVASIVATNGSAVEATLNIVALYGAVA
jgi:hypothetical protein